MKSFDLKMKSVEVKTTTRPIRTQWTAEMAADLRAAIEARGGRIVWEGE